MNGEGIAGFVSIEEICKKHIRGAVMDVFYLVLTNGNISKAEMIREFLKYDPDPNAKPSKYRVMVDVAVAKLHGALFIDSWDSGNSAPYFLTQYGKEADQVLKTMFEEDSTILLLGSKIMAKAMIEEEG
ncbi:hypothetical protein WJ0W_007155 [Paenibacillus melissococcoides]|uniref:Uncharacterized protein n=1 Tax=Paenibacillus melissococcoides TaxID=2912268 RepID=A0ABM9G904_9BACL|nr:hypothetical protein [Paenibacillus melissococcoides]CAH8248488.1 hypothetical protein WJ0W_007155 [Paenibacillus melissococcoides]CAH8722080.1 hypothetical protein HTL2_006685 [Paenibacillus melissococcoides]CAH8722109.1 hypothetical protein WDD9_006624 [Paenibacillus melissococcoides]